MTLQWNTFLNCIKEMHTLSEELHDGWILRNQEVTKKFNLLNTNKN